MEPYRRLSKDSYLGWVATGSRTSKPIHSSDPDGGLSGPAVEEIKLAVMVLKGARVSEGMGTAVERAHS